MRPTQLAENVRTGNQEMVMRNSGAVTGKEIPREAPRHVQGKARNWVRRLGMSAANAVASDENKQLSLGQTMAMEMTRRMGDGKGEGTKGFTGKDWAVTWVCIKEALEPTAGGLRAIENPDSPYYIADVGMRTQQISELEKLQEDIEVHLTQPGSEKIILGRALDRAVSTMSKVFTGTETYSQKEKAKKFFTLRANYDKVFAGVATEMGLNPNDANEKAIIVRETITRMLVAQDSEAVKRILNPETSQETPSSKLIEDATKNGTDAEKFLVRKLAEGELSKIGESLLRNKKDALAQVRTADGLLKYLGYDKGDPNLSKIMTQEDVRKALSGYLGREVVQADLDSELKKLFDGEGVPGVITFVHSLYRDKLERTSAERALAGKVKEEKKYTVLEKTDVFVKDLSNLSEEELALMILQKDISIKPAKGTTVDANDISQALQRYGLSAQKAGQMGTSFVGSDLMTYDPAKGWELNPQGRWRNPEAIAYLVGTGQLQESDASSMTTVTHPADPDYFDREIKQRSVIFDTSKPINDRKTALGKWSLKRLATIVAIMPGLTKSLVPLMSDDEKTELSGYLK